MKPNELLEFFSQIWTIILCVCHTTSAQNSLFAALTGWTTTVGRLLDPKMIFDVLRTPDALPHRESNQGFATFRFLARCLNQLSCTAVAIYYYLLSHSKVEANPLSVKDLSPH